MDEDVDPGPNVNRRRKRIIGNKEEREGCGSSSDGDSSDDFAFLPAKRGRTLKNKPLQNLNTYDSIKRELLREKQKPPRKAPVRKLKTAKASTTLRDDVEDDEDPDLKMSARMVDRIAALNDGKRTKVGIANCFENRTALDCIDVCLKESENMQEDAVALAIATSVYSLRVDRTHNDAQETRYTFIRGKTDAEKAMLVAASENLENTKDKRRKKKAEKDSEARKEQEIGRSDGDPNNIHQSQGLEGSDYDNFDYTFGLKFPVKGCSLHHWSFSQELLERVYSRRIDVRKTRRKRKVITWKKIPPLDFCPMYTEFMQVTANLESDRVDALASFRARRDITGKVIILHEAMVRKPAPRSVYERNVELLIVKQCRDMLANALRKEPTTWEHYLLEDNPRLYRAGQYLKTGDMTGYVFRERPFYQHFDPEKEAVDDDPKDSFSYVEKNADKTLYTFKKPPVGRTPTRVASLIRVPTNKFANPRNRKIEDIYFKEDVDVKPFPESVNQFDLLTYTESLWEQLNIQDLSGTDLALVNYNSFTTESLSDPIVELNRDDEIRADDIGRSLLSRLRERHQRHLDDVERLNEEFKETARTRCSSLVKELFTPSTFLSESVEEREDSDEDPKQCKTDEFLKTIGMSEESLGDKMHDLFSKMFTSSSSMGSDIQKRKKIIASVLGTGREAFEWRVSEGTILSDISHVVQRGIHSDIRYIDATYHMKVFKFRVTVEQAHESLRKAERIGAGMTLEELAALKQKCFRPGRYNGIQDSGQVSRFYRTDPWCSEAATLSFSEHYFSCRNYPKLEGALLQLCNDIQEAAKKIPSTSWYYTTISAKVIDDDRKNWRRRLNEAISLFNSLMSESEERSFWDGRMLPKLPRRSYNAQRQSQSKKVAQPVVESSTSNCVEEQQNDTSVEQGGNGNDVAGGDAEEDHCGGDNVDDNEANSISSFIYPDNDCAGIEEQVRAASVNMTPTSTNSSENVENDRGRKNQTVGDSVGEPPKKREKKVKTEPEIKVEQVEREYFDKRNVHSHVPLSERFSIAADPKTLIRGDDTVIMPRKQMACNLLTEYKFEDFVKPGLLHDGYYTAVKLEVDESVYKIEGKFCGALTRSAKQEEPCPDNPTLDTELSVSDAWLTTFGGFRGFPENDNLASGVPSCFTAGGENGLNLSESENIGANMDDSFNDSIYYPSKTNKAKSKKDRFHDIRPDEFKAIGIDVKNLLPKKDFYSMTKEEQAAAVAAEFEAIDALGPKKEDGYVISIMDFSYRITPYYLNTAKMKRVMKSILSNPLLAYDKVLYTRRALLARRRAVEQNSQEYGPEVYFKQLDRTLDESLGPLAVKILERHNPMDITALDPIDVLEAVTYRNMEEDDLDEEPKSRCQSTIGGVEESMRQFAAEVRQADFKVQGLHTFSSVMKCLPRRMGNSGKYVNAANALAVTLYMCNENSLTLVQERFNSMNKNASVKNAEPWMGNFIITNAVDNGVFSD